MGIERIEEIVEFKFEHLDDYARNQYREWSMGNGIGGYAGGNILGGNNRTHQGYLIASLHPPVERYLVLSKVTERVEREDMPTTDFTCARHRMEDGTVRAHNGNEYLKEFVYSGCANFFYQTFRERYRKTIALQYGQNTCAIRYEVQNDSDEPMRFVMTPLINYREHSSAQTVEGLQELFDHTGSGDCEKGYYVWTVQGQQICLASSEGVLRARKAYYDVNTMLQTEIDNEVDGLDCHYRPLDLVVEVAAHEKKTVALLCGLNPDWSEKLDDRAAVLDTVNEIVTAADARVQELITLAGDRKVDEGWNNFYESLVQASDALIVRRDSTGYKTILAGLPWFTDWGRDTMIAFTGLTLCTNRLADAREILLTFAKYVHHGMVPNMFPDDGQDPLYNTADASLWYFYAVHKYLEYDQSKEGRAFIMREIYPALTQIIEGYRNGTDFSIYMDEDGLIHAGSGVDQVTWMDVRVGDWVPTPRHGKPVEINALWYNALKIMEALSSEEAEEYGALAEKVKASYVRRFWYEEGGYLYDVVDEDDPQLRPNQIYAVSLPYSLLDEQKERMVVEKVYEKLYVGVGLRSLSPDDPEYHPIYQGALSKRDAAYHQGTAWGFLLGAFVTAYVKVMRRSLSKAEVHEKALQLLVPVKEHLRENGIGTISEIFDGDAPHYGRGCYSQAWSVGEVLRCLCEDIMTEQKLGMTYHKDRTTLRLWSPMAQSVEAVLYQTGDEGEPIRTIQMTRDASAVWTAVLEGDCAGLYYMYRCTFKNEDGTIRHTESQDPYSVATGVNGKRSMILDLAQTDPDGFAEDAGPKPQAYTDLVITEMSVRDTTADTSIDVKADTRGRYLGLAQPAVIDYLKQLGVTHVQLMPIYDFGSVDERIPVDEPGREQYNWGYDPVNYNVPEGSYASDPFDGAVRVREVKEMIMALHKAGFGVIMDVVYNHTYDIENSCFQKTTPDYFYRKDGDRYSDASACGNEIASDREMVRNYIIASVQYWMREYHIDGFRFDLMGVLDCETMREIEKACRAINPNVILYGEGWTGGDSVLAAEQRALKVNVHTVPNLGAFSDDFRDCVKGHVFYEEKCGFVNGAAKMENDMRYVIVAATEHPQVDYKKYQYTKGAWAKNPCTTIQYLSCHDNLTLWDKLAKSRPDATEEERYRMNQLAAAILFTSQGVPFFLLGEEMLRTKPLPETGELCENSFNRPIATNALRYLQTEPVKGMRAYYQKLIALRKMHALFRLRTAEEIREKLHFFEHTKKNVVAYHLADETEELIVIFNANPSQTEVSLKKEHLECEAWEVLLGPDDFQIGEKNWIVPGISAVVAGKRRNHEI